jgi:hypothetical protein
LADEGETEGEPVLTEVDVPGSEGAIALPDAGDDEVGTTRSIGVELGPEVVFVLFDDVLESVGVPDVDAVEVGMTTRTREEPGPDVALVLFGAVMEQVDAPEVDEVLDVDEILEVDEVGATKSIGEGLGPGVLSELLDDVLELVDMSDVLGNGVGAGDDSAGTTISTGALFGANGAVTSSFVPEVERSKRDSSASTPRRERKRSRRRRERTSAPRSRRSIHS